MLRLLSIVMVIVLLLVGVGVYSMQRLPAWFDDQAHAEQQAIDALSNQIQKEGVQAFLNAKLRDIVRGKVSFNEAEFNALLLASLMADEDGRLLLSVSDAVHVRFKEGEIELSAVFNLDKIEAVSPEAREQVERFDRLFFFLEDARVALSVYATPVVRDGKIGIKDDFDIKVGAIPISNNTLRQLGLDVARANQANLALRFLNLRDAIVKEGEIEFVIRPRL